MSFVNRFMDIVEMNKIAAEQEARRRHERRMKRYRWFAAGAAVLGGLYLASSMSNDETDTVIEFLED